MFNRFQTSYGHFLFKHRDWVLPLFTVTLLAAFRPLTDFLHPEAAPVMAWGGIATVLLGASIRIAVVGLAYIKRGGIAKKVAADTLVTSGMFSHCRNPLYAGNFLIAMGFMIAHGNPWVIFIGAAFFAYSYSAIVMAEEDFLKRKFGAVYAEYCRGVPRWNLRFSGLIETFQSMKFDWKRVLVKEYATIYTWSTTLLAIFAYKAALGPGLQHAVPLLYVFIPMQIALVAVKLYKKGKEGRLLPSRNVADAPFTG